MRAAGDSVKSVSGSAVPTPRRRTYVSAFRDDQARSTRRTIVAAAAELFLAHGYAATTTDAIAAAAGVSRKTVFAAGGGKFALLKDAYDWALVGDDEPVAMVDREPVQRILAATDPLEAVRLWAAMVTDTATRSAPISVVLQAAAKVDPQAAELQRTADRHRHGGAQGFVAHLSALGGLRPELTHDEAADLCWLANDPVNYTRLVIERGWSPERFRDRLDALIRWELLGH